EELANEAYAGRANRATKRPLDTGGTKMKTHLALLGLLATVALLVATAAAPTTRAAAAHAGFGIERVAYATSPNGSTSKKDDHAWRSMTLAASPLKVVFGKAVKLSGLLTEGGAAVGGQ